MQSYRDIEIIVVDNGSSDGSAKMVMSGYEGIRLIENKENLFYCRANNQGIEAAGGDFILCLNSDCALDKDYLKNAMTAFLVDERIGMVSGKILRPDKRTIDSTGLFVARSRKPLERGYGKIDKGQYDKPGYVFGVSGSCMLMKKNMLDYIKDGNGYFDEAFEIYYEDLDLCWRAQKKGWKAYYIPEAIAYHERGATAIGYSGKRGFRYLSDELKKRYIKNRYKCTKKNDTIEGIILNLPFILLYEIKIHCYMFGKCLTNAIF